MKFYREDFAVVTTDVLHKMKLRHCWNNTADGGSPGGIDRNAVHRHTIDVIHDILRHFVPIK
ncbi:hypothetical protein F6P94_11185 [Escherichia coli]|nr:hypothetical protein F6P94_11185 [Escherichia coli]